MPEPTEQRDVLVVLVDAMQKAAAHLRGELKREEARLPAMRLQLARIENALDALTSPTVRRKATRPGHSWSPEQRAAASERMRGNNLRRAAARHEAA